VTSIRGIRDADLPRLREICLRTGAGGEDATGLRISDDLLPDVFLSPYAAHDPSWCWAAVDEHDVAIGYLIAAPDTRAFVAWWRAAWTPGFAARWEGVDAGADTWLVERGRHPEGMIPEELVEAYPAHLHIDLLAAARGGGVGRRLMELLFARLREAGVPGVHLGLDPANTGARAFYERLGFRAASTTGDLMVREV
jgi:ribosomal protein S18 acetylase RimI-like enzyme